MSDLWRLRRRSRRAPDRRAELARIPERPKGVNRIQPLLDTAREAGVAVEEIDEEHVRLRYDARMRDQWLAVEAIYDAVQELASLEGDGLTDAAPDNWMVVHFDFASCGESLKP
jgi:hypothetical protein